MSDSTESLSVGDTITMTWGKELICPVKFNNFEIGPFTAGTTIRPGEDVEAATTRVHAVLADLAKAEFEGKLTGFLARLRVAAARAKG